MVDQLKNEIYIMTSITHPCIIDLYTYFEDSSNIFLVMELADGHLYGMLKKKGKFDEYTAAKYMRDATSAIAYLHSRNPPIIHRDIKPENLLIVGDTLKVADFGWSNIKDNNRKTYCGTPDYLAPEMIQETGHSEKLDIWTLGILMYELLQGKAPFTPTGGKDRREKMRRLEVNILNLNIDFTNGFPPKAKRLILRMLQRNPDYRPIAEEVLMDAWQIGFGLKPVINEEDETPMESGKRQQDSSKSNIKQSLVDFGDDDANENGSNVLGNFSGVGLGNSQKFIKTNQQFMKNSNDKIGMIEAELAKSGFMGAGIDIPQPSSQRRLQQQKSPDKDFSSNNTGSRRYISPNIKTGDGYNSQKHANSNAKKSGSEHRIITGGGKISESPTGVTNDRKFHQFQDKVEKVMDQITNIRNNSPICTTKVGKNGQQNSYSKYLNELTNNTGNSTISYNGSNMKSGPSPQRKHSNGPPQSNSGSNQKKSGNFYGSSPKNSHHIMTDANATGNWKEQLSGNYNNAIIQGDSNRMCKTQTLNFQNGQISGGTYQSGLRENSPLNHKYSENQSHVRKNSGEFMSSINGGYTTANDAIIQGGVKVSGGQGGSTSNILHQQIMPPRPPSINIGNYNTNPCYGGGTPLNIDYDNYKGVQQQNSGTNNGSFQSNGTASTNQLTSPINNLSGTGICDDNSMEILTQNMDDNSILKKGITQDSPRKDSVIYPKQQSDNQQGCFFNSMTKPTAQQPIATIQQPQPSSNTRSDSPQHNYKPFGNKEDIENVKDRLAKEKQAKSNLEQQLDIEKQKNISQQDNLYMSNDEISSQNKKVQELAQGIIYNEHGKIVSVEEYTNILQKIREVTSDNEISKKQLSYVQKQLTEKERLERENKSLRVELDESKNLLASCEVNFTQFREDFKRKQECLAIEISKCCEVLQQFDNNHSYSLYEQEGLGGYPYIIDAMKNQIMNLNDNCIIAEKEVTNFSIIKKLESRAEEKSK